MREIQFRDKELLLSALNRAVEEIVEQRSRAALENKGWIKMSEITPADNECVLVYSEALDWPYIGVGIFEDSPGENRFLVQGRQLKYVELWRPLPPSPPEELL